MVFLLFVQGGQTLLYTVAKNEDERNLLVNSLGRKWEFTFTTLVVFGGAFFASFPLFYSTSFGGAYLAWMVVLFCFVIQAVSYEYRRKANNFLGERTYNAFLVVNGILGTICIGAVVSSFFTGNPFTLGDMNQVTWQSAWRGLEVLFSFTNLCLGFSIFFLARTLAVLYFLNNIDNDAIYERSRQQVVRNSLMPLNTTLLVIGIAGVLFGIIKTILHTQWRKGIWYAGFGVILTVIALFILAGFNNTAFYPSYTDLNSSLTIHNASSSHYTLETMAYVSIITPLVIAYIFYAWRALNKKRINLEEIKEDHHAY